MSAHEEAEPENREAPGAGMWGGRFEAGLAPEMAALNLSLDVDARLWRQDVRGSRAWVRALHRAGVLTADEARALRTGLDGVARRLEEGGLDTPSRGAFSGVDDEDVHSLVERLLREEIGALAGKLHTGRSRNDQAATDLRLWGITAAVDLDEAVRELCGALLDLAERSIELLMPGYTHLQRGQPVRVAHWALSHFWPLDRDRKRLHQAHESASVLPLGSGALAGCPYAVDRVELARDLGFARVHENSMDAVSDRDWVSDLVYAGATIGVHLSRLCEDLLLFCSSEFGFLRLADAYSTGSSLMPQKRNPDVAELVRGKSGRLSGNLTALLTLSKGLPTGYNRDLQEDKPPLFDTVDTLMLLLPPLTGAVRTAAFDSDRLAEALDPQLLATDLADYLVRRGVPFRESHAVVGRVVRRAEETGVTIDALPLRELREIHQAFDEDVRDVFDWEVAVDARDTRGGTSRRAVNAQIDRARRAVQRGE